MPRYRIIIHGCNLLLDYASKRQKMGFYISHFTHAPNPCLALQAALTEFLESPRAQELTQLLLNSPKDPPQFLAEDVKEIGLVDTEQTSLALAFYQETKPASDDSLIWITGVFLFFVSVYLILAKACSERVAYYTVFAVALAALFLGGIFMVFIMPRYLINHGREKEVKWWILLGLLFSIPSVTLLWQIFLPVLS
jgi:hypothetical protein